VGLEGSAHPPGDSLYWQFHFGDDGTQPFRSDGTFDANFARFCRTEHTYTSSGSYVATVSVTDKHLEDQSRSVSGLARVTQRLTILVGPSVSAAPAPAIFVCYATNFTDFAQTAPINTSPNGDFYFSSDGTCSDGIDVEGTLVRAADLSSASATCSSLLGPRGIVSGGAVAAGGDLAADYWFCSYVAPT
jgi:PKD domain